MVPKEGNVNLGRGIRGAYTNVLVIARSESDYSAKVTAAFEALNFIVQEIEGQEPFEERKAKYQLKRRLSVLANKVLRTGEMQHDQFRKFHFDNA